MRGRRPGGKPLAPALTLALPAAHPSRMVLRAFAAFPLLLCLAVVSAGAGEMILNGVRVLGDEPADERVDWSACRVRADLVQTGAGGTRTLASENRVLILGENLDFEGTYTISNGARQGLVNLLVRLRSSTVREDGVMYLVTSEGELQAAVGFTAADSSRRQFRHDFVEIGSGLVSPREVFVSPELGIRVLLIVSAEPVRDEVEESLIPSSAAAEIISFRIEAKRRFAGKIARLNNQVLQAAPGHDASFEVVLRDPGDAPDEDEDPPDPDFPLGGRARIVDLARTPASGFGEDHFATESTLNQDFLERNSRRGDTSYISEHSVETGTGPIASSMRLPNKKKLSKKKQRELRESAEIRGAKELALERSKTLAGREGAPVTLARSEQLQVHLTPLHVTEKNLRLRIRLQGYMALEGDEQPREIDLSFTENVGWGLTLELGLREILEGGEPESDTIIAITPQP